MALKLKSIFNMKRFLSLLPIIALTSCVSNTLVLDSEIFCFGGVPVDITLNQGNKGDVKELENITYSIDALSDNYLARDINNVYTLNHTNNAVTANESLYDLIQKANNAKDYDSGIYFNPLCGSLSKAWKESLSENKVLSNEVIEEELTKLDNSNLEFLDNNQIKRNGESEIDLGGIAKGYTLDIAKEYLVNRNIKNYLINAGRSSLLIGEKVNTSNGLFRVGLPKEEYPNHHIKVKNCFVSTSGTAEQGRVIEGVKYSHIVNPITGSAINNYDAVIVISDVGYLGDVLSTSMMMCTIDQIKQIETDKNVKVIVIKDHKIEYKNSSIEVYRN